MAVFGAFTKIKNMKIVPEKRLFWFLRDNIKMDLSNPTLLDMYI
jgi:hypothetical protein